MECSLNSTLILKCTLCIDMKLLRLTHYILNLKYMNTVLIASSINCGKFRYIKMKLPLQSQDCFIQKVEILGFVRFAAFIFINCFQTMIHSQNTRNLVRIVNSFLYLKISITNQQFNIWIHLDSFLVILTFEHTRCAIVFNW